MTYCMPHSNPPSHKINNVHFDNVRNEGSLPPTPKDFGCERVQYFKVTPTVSILDVIHPFIYTDLNKENGWF